jgi:hypothetical protein
MGGELVVRVARGSEHAIAYVPVMPREWETLDLAQRRRAATLTPELAAARRSE